MGISVWSSWDSKPLTEQYTREARIIKTACLKNALTVLDSVLKPPTVVSFYGAELVVTDTTIYYSGKLGNAWAKSASLAKRLHKSIVFMNCEHTQEAEQKQGSTFHDIVKEG